MLEDAGITTLGPVLPKLAGVVCTSAALGSHLAIVTREFSIPALTGTKLETSEDLNQRRVVIQPTARTDSSYYPTATDACCHQSQENDADSVKLHYPIYA